MIAYKDTLQQISNKLSNQKILFDYGGLRFDVQWFRVCLKENLWKMQKHRHSSFEFHLVASGECSVTTPDAVFVARENEFYLTPPNLYHLQQSAGADHYVEYSINLDITPLQHPATTDNGLLAVLQNASCINYRDSENLIGVFEKALVEADCKQYCYLDQLHCALISIVTLAARIINRTEKLVPVNVYQPKMPDYRFDLIEKFVWDNMALPLTTNDVSDYAHLCNKQISRIIHKSTGLTTHKYIAHSKYTHAKKLLRNSNSSIKEIGQAVGFDNQYSFSIFFKSHSGLSPKAYRQQQTSVKAVAEQQEL